MRRLAFLTAFLFVGYSLKAQTSVPQGIAYQAVAIKPNAQGISGSNVDGLYWTNRDIAVRFTIYDKWPGGNNEYSETHELTTDAFGTFSCVIGQGSPITGSFSNISWDLGTAHLQVEIDYHRNGQFTLIGVERFWSVPYSLVSNESLKSTGALGYSKSQIDSMTNILLNQIQYLKNRDKDTAIGNDGVSMSYVDSQMNKLISLYNSVKASDRDTVVGNEIQALSMSNDSIVLSRNGGGVLLMDNDPINEIQLLSIVNDSLMITDGNGVPIAAFGLGDLTLNNDTLSLANGSVQIDLSKYLDNTDNQKLTLNNGVLSLERGGSVTLPSGGKAATSNRTLIYTNEGF